MTYPDLASIHATAERCKAENIPLPESALRRFVKNGDIPAILSGNRALLHWSNVLLFVQQGNGPQKDTRPHECDDIKDIGGMYYGTT